MISKPKYGWCDFELNEFKASPNNLTNVPIDLLDCFISYFKNGAGICRFKCKDKDFTLVLSYYEVFIIYTSEDGYEVYNDYLTDINNMSIRLIDDIYCNFSEWASWSSTNNENKNQSKSLLNKINQLESLLKNKYKH